MLKALLRLYPTTWRERYGDEFLAVLEEQRLSPRLLLDVLAGALDAHLYQPQLQTTDGQPALTLATRADLVGLGFLVPMLAFWLRWLGGMLVGAEPLQVAVTDPAAIAPRWIALTLICPLLAVGISMLSLLRKRRAATPSLITTVLSLTTIAVGALEITALTGFLVVDNLPVVRQLLSLGLH
jgi:hypothetical protein